MNYFVPQHTRVIAWELRSRLGGNEEADYSRKVDESIELRAADLEWRQMDKDKDMAVVVVRR